MNKKQWIALIVAVSMATLGGSRYFVDSVSDHDALSAKLKAVMEEASPIGNVDYWKLPIGLEDIPQDPNNPLTWEKAALGFMLFNDTMLTTSGTSCATCHGKEFGGYDGKAQSVGFGGIGEGLERFILPNADKVDAPAIKSPTTFNVAYRPNSLWSNKLGAGQVTFPVGGEHVKLTATVNTINNNDSLFVGNPLIQNHLHLAGAETQVFGAIGVHEFEPNLLLKNKGKWIKYKVLFKNAFPELDEKEYLKPLTIAKAIAAFERTQITTNNRFQKYLRGESTLTLRQKRGAILAFTECTGCHNLPSFAGTGMFAMGHGDMWMRDDFFGDIPNGIDGRNDRYAFTKDTMDCGKYPPMQWYSVTKGNFYGHGSTYNELREFVHDHANGVVQNKDRLTLGLPMDTLNLKLTEKEIGYLVDFIKSLEED